MLPLWTPSGKQLAEWNAQSPVTSLSFSDDGKNIATAQLDGTVRVWNVPTLDELMSQGCKWLEDNISKESKAEKQKQQRLCRKYSK